MKFVGIIFIAIGLALLAFVIYLYLNEGKKTVSPLPEDKGIKVIFVTPTI